MTALLRHLRYVLGENLVTLIAFALFVLLVALAVLGPWIEPYDPLATDAMHALAPPSAAHWFGTDAVGRDILSRIVAATRLDLGIAFAAVVLSFAIGALAGLAAGYFGGWTERLVGRAADTIMAFPLFVLAMGIVAALGNTVANIVYATAIINMPLYARVARNEASVLREAGFIEAARLGGNGEYRILLAQIHAQCDAYPGGADVVDHGLCDPERGRAVVHRPRHQPADARNGGSWSPRGPATSSPANGGSHSFQGWR